MPLELRPATPADVPVILGFIRDLAAYERLLDQVEATADRLRATLFPASSALSSLARWMT